jgi:alpha-tubulin suppressor-like RCC1 family protein
MLNRRLVTLALVAGLSGCRADQIVAPRSTPPSGNRLAVGETTACALDDKGVVYCWGTNSLRMEYGDTSAQSNSPIAVGVPILTALSVGAGQHMCGIAPSRQALCWGRGQFGQLGGGTLGAIGNPPTPVQQGTWARIAVSRLNTCAVSLNDVGYCWGSNQRGNLGNNSLDVGGAVAIASPVATEHVFRSVVPGWLHTCAIATNGAAYCWGDNTNGQLGTGFTDTDVHLDPLLISFTEQFEQIAVGARSTCGITIDHRALCWGFNGTGQLGDGTRTQRSAPVQVASTQKFVAIAMASGFSGGTTTNPPLNTQGGNAHTCAITEAGVPYCWGWNGNGQIGDGTTIDRLVPTLVQGNLILSTIALGGTSSCGMLDKSIWCWGSNSSGQLGNGTRTNSLVPVPVALPFNQFGLDRPAKP